MGQAFQAAAINAKLTALLIFSDSIKEDKLIAKQWLEKVIINKTGGKGQTFRQSPTSEVHSEVIWSLGMIQSPYWMTQP